MRYKSLRVSTYILLEILKHGCLGIQLVSGALPEDTKFVCAGHDRFGFLFLTLESQEWPELAEGDEIPEIDSPVFEKK